MKIDNIKIKGKVVLAPMAGISNPAFMKIVAEMGLSLAYTELISAEAVVRNNQKTFDMLNGIETLKIPIGVQLFGSNIETLTKAAKIITDLYPNVFIDINMGCPVPKVAVKSQAGSALLKNIPKIKEIVKSVVEAVPCPVTVKIRSGWDEEHINAKEVAIACEEAGASAITIHPRTRSQGYKGNADWDIIKEVKESVKIPVIGNGDITDIYKAKKMLDETGCDLIMIGRGLLGNPWLIKEINEYLDNNKIISKPTPIERIDIALKHIRYLQEFKKEREIVLLMRSYIAWYIKGLPQSKDIKDKIYKTKNLNEVIEILNEYRQSFV